MYMYTCTCRCVDKAGNPGVPSYYNIICLSGLWLGGLLYLSFLSYFFKLVCYAHVFPCIYMYIHQHQHMYMYVVFGLHMYMFLNER